MRALVILAALALSACASTSEQVAVDGSAQAASTIVVGTLSTNPCEMQTASTYTAAQVLVERTTKAVRAGVLPAASAQQVLDLGRAARADLDAACARDVLDSAKLAAAQSRVDQMQTILGGAR